MSMPDAASVDSLEFQLIWIQLSSRQHTMITAQYILLREMLVMNMIISQSLLHLCQFSETDGDTIYKHCAVSITNREFHAEGIVRGCI